MCATQFFARSRANVVGIPGRARETAGRMPWPPGDAHAALELVALRPQHARDLEHAGVTRGVVADADVPGIVVAVQQHELFAASLDFHHRHRLLEPALVELGARVSRCRPSSPARSALRRPACSPRPPGIAGLYGRSSRSAVPQIGLPPPQCATLPGLIAITPTAPSAWKSLMRSHMIMPWNSTILPLTSPTPGAGS